MTRAILGAGLLALALLACGGQPATEGPDVAVLAASCDSLTTVFMGALKGELMVALEGGDPAQAVAVCKEMAPALTAEYSARPGFRVQRISDRPRNPGNAPVGYQADMLARLAASESPALYEWVYETEGDSSFVFLKAIRMGEPCLACHGPIEGISSEVAEMLSMEYPNDHATGYGVGEFRGAVVVTYRPAQDES